MRPAQAFGSAQEARRVYDQLLGARGTAPHAEALQAPVLRLRLLRSLLYLVHIEAVRCRQGRFEYQKQCYSVLRLHSGYSCFGLVIFL